LSDRVERRLLLLGAGGHARVLQELLSLQGTAVEGYLAPTSESRLHGAEWLGDDDALRDIDPSGVLLVNGIGSTEAGGRRRSAYRVATGFGFEFLRVIDASAIVRPSAVIGEGVQVLAGAIVNSNTVIGENTIVNSGSIVEHDSILAANVHVSPGAVLGGGVRVGDGSHIGLGARVLQGVSIGSDCTIGAGAVVTHDFGDGVVAVGVPAVARSTTAAS
jgi:UDP-perosamine 4-acetyltransferase